MEPIITEQISNHPIFTNVERFVEVTLQQANSMGKVFEFHFQIKYVSDGDDITNTLAQPTINKIGTDATTKQLIRTEEGEPIENPDFAEEDFSEEFPATEYDRYLWMYGWDLIKMLISQPTNISSLIRQYIHINDESKFFDI